MDIKAITTTTLTDYPGLVAATLFMGGCDFQCPFCYHKSLVINPHKLPNLDLDEILSFLESRKGVLEGVCLSGGEPLLQQDLFELIYQLKSIGYKVKIDTNGYSPGPLNQLIKENMVDYIAMDIKHSKEKYESIIGLNQFDLTRIKLSVDLIKGSSIPYEFRTTVVKELHQPEDFLAIGEWLYDAKAYYLQPYTATDDVILPVFSSYTKKELLKIKSSLVPYIPKVTLRGFD